MSNAAENHILLSKGLPMIDIIGTIVNAISGFFTSALETITGSITGAEAGDE